MIPLPTMAFITPWDILSMFEVIDDNKILSSEMVSALIDSYKDS